MDEKQIEHKGLVFTKSGAIPYVRKSDGKEMELDVWTASCIDCGGPFEIKVPHRAGPVESNAFEQRRCRPCVAKRVKP